MPTPQMFIIRHMTKAAEQITDMRGLFLAGSFGTGTVDAFSDVDFVAVVRDGTDLDVADRWRLALQEHTPVVFWNQQKSTGVLLNAVAENWQRIDLFTCSEAALKNRVQEDLLPLVDPENLYSKLSETAATAAPSPARIEATINEFIRVLGLLHVVLGREEYVTGVWGAGLQRDAIATLLTMKDGIRATGGALHQSKTMSAGSMDILKTLPYPPPERAALLDANATLAKVFFPLARGMADKHGVPWPHAFEEATKAILKSHFIGEFQTDWDG